MHAYATVAMVSPDFASHSWAVKNLKEEDQPDDFSTIWTTPDDDCNLDAYDDAVYFYGGRDAIYQALANFEYARIRNFVTGHRRDPIHVFRAQVKVTSGKRKQIIMLAVADATRDQDLSAFRDTELEEEDANYRMREFRERMKAKWPGIG